MSMLFRYVAVLFVFIAGVSASALKVENGVFTNGDPLPVTPDNYAAYSQRIETVGRAYSGSEAPELKPSSRYEVSAKLPKLMLLRSTADGVHEMREFGGHPRYFRSRIVDGKLEWTGVKKPANPIWTVEPYKRIDTIYEPRIPRDIKHLQGDRDTLVRKLVNEIGDTSRTAKDPDPANAARAEKTLTNLDQAIRYALKLEDEKQPLTLERLERIHYLLAKGALRPDEANLAAGILRGSQPRSVTDDKGNKVTVDLRKLSLRMGEQNVMSYVHPGDVPKHMERLLKRVNAIGPHSKPSEAAQIYNDFLQTHPFIDGNGRMSRILMAMMQVKMGAPLTPVGMDGAYMAFYLSPVELANLISGEEKTELQPVLKPAEAAE